MITIGVPIITALLIAVVVITAILSSLITYYCCVRSKEGHSPLVAVTAGPYEIPVSTMKVSSLEMKDNMAYGHVTIDTSGNTSTPAVYEPTYI